MSEDLKPMLADAVLKVLDGEEGSFVIPEEDVTRIKWLDGNPNGITEKNITDKFKELTDAWESRAYKRNRELEYPTIEELTVAMYDADDKAALEVKRAAVKKKWPKDNSGPVE